MLTETCAAQREEMRMGATASSFEQAFGADGMADPAHIRRVVRRGGFTGHTSGLAPNRVQGNVVILPAALADDFRDFCARNPKPCPLLAVSAPGCPTLPALGDDLDIRTDVPRYRVFRDGEVVLEPTDISALFRDDLVTFVLGCSFSFEHPLREAGIRLRHVEAGKNVAMYRTNVDTVPAGPFTGKLVVSMRPLSPADAERARTITAGMPRVHGAPVHIGDPEALGIRAIAEPDFGDPVDVLPGEVCVFHACGVTPQLALAHARPALAITHAPGAMLVTDLFHHQLQGP
jgi:uncharacterized protein YcsI (UPF0317 family)